MMLRETATYQAYGLLKSETTFDVNAKLAWQNTNIKVKKGNWIIIEYRYGSWSADKPDFSYTDASGYPSWMGSPEYYCPNCGAPIPKGVLGQLVYKIETKIDYVSSLRAIQSTDDGFLFLMMNDSFNALADNDGKITVKISIYWRDK